MLSKKLRYYLSFLDNTPLHPQWIVYSQQKACYSFVGNRVTGKTLDIGCGNQNVLQFINKTAKYYSLDYPTTNQNGYNAVPDVYGSAVSLPFKDNSFDTIILLEVLEHVQNPDKAIKEVQRILKPGGQIFFSTPFLYPIHDAPWDFHRWTEHGLLQLFSKANLKIKDSKLLGSPIETGVLLLNLSITYTTLKTPIAIRPICLILLIVAVPILNLFSMIGKLFSQNISHPFPTGYLYSLQKDYQ